MDSATAGEPRLICSRAAFQLFLMRGGGDKIYSVWKNAFETALVVSKVAF